MDTLDPVEARIVGCLVEKAFTTADQYPLSLNALVSACNQKSNREPEMSLGEEAVFDALMALRARGWVTMVMPSTGRVERWRHQLRDKLGLDGLQQALIAELLLRGPQTSAELRTRASRMKPFESAEVVQNVLASLAAADDSRTALVKRIPPAPGERAERWAQLVSPDSHELVGVAAGGAGARAAGAGEGEGMSTRLTDIEIRVLALENDVKSLRQELGL